MAKQQRETISIKPDSSQLKGLYAAFKRLDEDANKQLKDDVASISKWTAGEIQAAAKQAPYMPRQAVLVAESIKFNRDRVPNVTIGGSKKAPVTRKVTAKSPAPKYGELLYGSEFGAVDYLKRRVNGSNKGANTFGKFGESASHLEAQITKVARKATGFTQPFARVNRKLLLAGLMPSIRY